MNGLFAVNKTENDQESQENTGYNEKRIAAGRSISVMSAMTGTWEE